MKPIKFNFSKISPSIVVGKNLDLFEGFITHVENSSEIVNKTTFKNFN